MPPLKLPVFQDSAPAEGDGDRPWRSLGEKASRPEPSRELGEQAPPLEASRRSVLQMLGASAAFATMAGCFKPPDEKILPYTKQPPEVTPGIPSHYATSSTLDGRATGLLVTSNEGRPTKIDGSPEHSSSGGGAGVLEQAALLSLYDPQRSKVFKYKSQPRSMHDFLAATAANGKSLQQTAGAGLRFLMEPSSSPLLLRMRERVLERYPKAKFVTWSAIPLQRIHDGGVLAFGAPYDTRLDLSKASVVCSLDADLLSAMPGTIAQMRQWAEKRDPENPMGRLYAVETNLTVTGMNADHRLRMKPSQVEHFGLALLGRLAQRVPALAQYAPLASKYELDAAQSRFANALAKDLVKAGKGALVAAGPRQPAMLHAAAHAINAALQSDCAKLAKPVLHDTDAGPRALLSLTQEMRAGAVDTLVITAWNPVYGAPFDLNFGKALSQVKSSVYRSLYEDETSTRAGWTLPALHPLETWGDARAHDGTVSFVQPLIAPLYGGMTEVEVLASFLGEGDRTTYTQLRDYWRTKSPDAFEMTWEKWLADGFIDGTATEAETPAVKHDAILAEANKARAAASGVEINIVPDYKVWDGRFANNAWLQELPDPVTKTTWENHARISPAFAAKLGVENGDLVDLGLRGPPAQGPVVIEPGHADDCVTVAMGYGRSGPGEELAKGLGFDTATLRHSDTPWMDTGLTVVVTGGKSPIAQTQEHHSMEGRLIAVSTTLARLPKAKERLEEERGVPLTYHQPVAYPGHRWGMTIDLGKCTGCNACMVACQSENNISVTGKDGVIRSREMHWIRVDRYFTGDENDPGVVFQPLMCVHCESAPCEYVCPVNATVHSDEGLNEMVYNRCVGTRYCSNNCPYKVRRFNFFNYTGNFSETEKMVFNPDVTVRSRGVMEKCTYCVQRIERMRITTRVQERAMRDGDVVTACQQACPSTAIVFGDLNDETSKVSKLAREERRYDLLHELGTRPRTGYLARVMNPNPELA
ncbi:MAG TPA: Fe-S-cluster-containing hydrogenase [Myxococcales bacterium]|nr:Fe-S-cluster-containing hydrogenase [Myxococcales bacterium]